MFVLPDVAEVMSYIKRALFIAGAAAVVGAVRPPVVSTEACQELKHADCPAVMKQAADIPRAVDLYNRVIASATAAGEHSGPCEAVSEIKAFIESASTDAAEAAAVLSKHCSVSVIEEHIQTVIDALAESVKASQLIIANEAVTGLFKLERAALAAIIAEGELPHTRLALAKHKVLVERHGARMDVFRRLTDHMESYRDPAGVPAAAVDETRPMMRSLLDHLASCREDEVETARQAVFDFWADLRKENFSESDIAALMRPLRELLLPPTAADAGLAYYRALIDNHMTISKMLKSARRIQQHLAIPHIVYSHL